MRSWFLPFIAFLTILTCAALLAFLLIENRQARPDPAVLIGAGDISVCGQDGDDKTAQLLRQLVRRHPRAVIFTAGDNSQTMGQMSEYIQCFEPAWGSFKNRIRPSPGNHDWFTEQGADYFTYFGQAAGDFGLGYYSFDHGNWHIVSLNSNCESAGCGEDSAQALWLRDDLEKSPQACTLLYWHHPIRSSGKVPVDLSGEVFWQIASDFGAEIVINGHDHHYERFVPLDRDGIASPDSGIRSFIVGTGGAWLFDLDKPLPITATRDNSTYGVILFLLYPDRYEWEFIPVKGGGYTDKGSGVCNQQI
ncbi:MAG: alkaline phosphatase [Chloroflexi bacterium]|nr:MAG: alkaline phosphatase [Chloroflexota bacterium]